MPRRADPRRFLLTCPDTTPFEAFLCRPELDSKAKPQDQQPGVLVQTCKDVTCIGEDAGLGLCLHLTGSRQLSAAKVVPKVQAWRFPCLWP